MTAMDQGRFVTLAEVAVDLGASRSAVRGWLEEAQIRAFCFGSGRNAKITFLREDVEGWVSECQETDDDLEEETDGETEDDELELGEQELAEAETCDDEGGDDDESDDSSDDDDDWGADEDEDEDDLGCPASATAAY